jgi:hypothetical protein
LGEDAPPRVPSISERADHLSQRISTREGGTTSATAAAATAAAAARGSASSASSGAAAAAVTELHPFVRIKVKRVKRIKKEEKEEKEETEKKAGTVVARTQRRRERTDATI